MKKAARIKAVNCDPKRIDVLPEGSLIQRLFRPTTTNAIFEGEYSAFSNLTVSGKRNGSTRSKAWLLRSP